MFCQVIASLFCCFHCKVLYGRDINSSVGFVTSNKQNLTYNQFMIKKEDKDNLELNYLSTTSGSGLENRKICSPIMNDDNCFLFYLFFILRACGFAQAYRAQTGGGGVKSAVKTPRARHGIRSNHKSINTGGFLCYHVSAALCTVLPVIQRGKTREISQGCHHVHQSITDYALFITNYQDFLKGSS
jgi:hypothetical protein